jgi:antitoxin component of RelBE/YafQ-DinJ toxin-antitoxin module
MSKRITIRLDDKLYNKIKNETEKYDMTLSDIIRIKLTEKNKINRICNQKWLNEINKIGININQIAKYINVQKIIDRAIGKELILMKDQLNFLIAEIKNDS